MCELHSDRLEHITRKRDCHRQCLQLRVSSATAPFLSVLADLRPDSVREPLRVGRFGRDHGDSCGWRIDRSSLWNDKDEEAKDFNHVSYSNTDPEHGSPDAGRRDGFSNQPLDKFGSARFAWTRCRHRYHCSWLGPFAALRNTHGLLDCGRWRLPTSPLER